MWGAVLPGVLISATPIYIPSNSVDLWISDGSQFLAAELQILITKEKKTDPVAEAILKGVANGVFTFEDYKAYKETGEYPQGMKDGGRAGYQVGGEVVEDVAMMSESANVAPTAPAQTQDLTYDELRSRLPREITNDVVSLIATSKAALTDFANIQTQQDVDNFNQTYNVNLVLPQEG